MSRAVERCWGSATCACRPKGSSPARALRATTPVDAAAAGAAATAPVDAAAAGTAPPTVAEGAAADAESVASPHSSRRRGRRSRAGTRSRDPDVPVLACDASLFLAEVRLPDRAHDRPVLADRAVLEPPQAQTYRLQGSGWN